LAPSSCQWPLLDGHTLEVGLAKDSCLLVCQSQSGASSTTLAPNTLASCPSWKIAQTTLVAGQPFSSCRPSCISFLPSVCLASSSTNELALNRCWSLFVVELGWRKLGLPFGLKLAPVCSPEGAVQCAALQSSLPGQKGDQLDRVCLAGPTSVANEH